MIVHLTGDENSDDRVVSYPNVPQSFPKCTRI